MIRELENKVIYQIYPKSYLDTTNNGYGDIQGIISKLDYIKDLGVDYIWLSPCCKSPQYDNGYDISDYLTIDKLFGSNEDYLELIDKAKARDMKIMMDLVLNHTSSEHEWFQKALQQDPKYYDYYIWADEPNDITSFFGGNAWTYVPHLNKYYFHLFDKHQPDLNWENPALRAEIISMVNTWIERGVGGFRLDVIDLIGKEPSKLITGKGPKFYTYLKELSNATFRNDLLTVGECWGSNLEETYQMCNPDGLVQAFNFNHLSLTDGQDKWDKQPISLERLCNYFEVWQNQFKGIEAVVMNNHDLPRLISTWLDDRKYRKQSAKLLITIFGLLKGNLYLYQGEEIGMRNAYCFNINKYNDVETLNKYQELKAKGLSEEAIMEIIARTSRDNARIPMAWNNQQYGGFSKVKPWLYINDNFLSINVENDLASEDSVYRYYQAILAYRKANYEKLNVEAKFSYHGDVLRIEKADLVIIANFKANSVPLTKEGEVVFNNYSDLSDNLQAYQVVVFKK